MFFCLTAVAPNTVAPNTVAPKHCVSLLHTPHFSRYNAFLPSKSVSEPRSEQLSVLEVLTWWCDCIRLLLPRLLTLDCFLRSQMERCSIKVPGWSWPFLTWTQQIPCCSCSSSTDTLLCASHSNTHLGTTHADKHTHLSHSEVSSGMTQLGFDPPAQPLICAATVVYLWPY